MDDKKFLIIGAYGQLGKALSEKYPNAVKVDSDTLDITDLKSLEAFDWQSIEVILNAAAYTNVDGAETQQGRKLAWKINAEAIANLAKIAKLNNIILVHISSDYVFDGTVDNHTESEEFSPLSVYGASKAAGDIACCTADKYYILRTSWVIGDGKNFVKTMIELANKNISPTVVSDQIGRLTFTSELVRAIDHLLIQNADYGVYNISNSGPSKSWADITRQIFEILGRNDLRVSDTSTEQYFKDKENIAPRPLKSTLDLSKIESTGYTPTDWQDNLLKYIKMETKQ